LKKAISKVEDQFIKPVETILQNNIKIIDKINKRSSIEIIRLLAIFYTYIFYNDTNRGVPHGYFCSVLNNRVTRKYSNEVFEGYRQGLQFLWKKLLKSDSQSLIIKFSNARNWKELDDFFHKIQIEIVEPLLKPLNISLSID